MILYNVHFVFYRYKVLCQNICTSRANKRCDVQAINVDFLKLNLNDPPFRDCTKAIVDPSCTGGVDFDREVGIALQSLIVTT